MKSHSLDRLPNEMVAMILKYLSKEDLLRVRKSSRRLNQLVLFNKVKRSKGYLTIRAHQRQLRSVDEYDRQIDLRIKTEDPPEEYRRLTISVEAGTAKNKEMLSSKFVPSSDQDGIGILNYFRETLRRIPYKFVDLRMDLQCCTLTFDNERTFLPIRQRMKNSLQRIIAFSLYKAFSDVVFTEKAAEKKNISILHLKIALQRPKYFVPLLVLLHRTGIPHTCIRGEYNVPYDCWMKYIPFKEICNSGFVHPQDFIHTYKNFYIGNLNFMSIYSITPHKAVGEEDFEWDDSGKLREMKRNGVTHAALHRPSDGRRFIVVLTDYGLRLSTVCLFDCPFDV